MLENEHRVAAATCMINTCEQESKGTTKVVNLCRITKLLQAKKKLLSGFPLLYVMFNINECVYDATDLWLHPSGTLS